MFVHIEQKLAGGEVAQSALLFACFGFELNAVERTATLPMEVRGAGVHKLEWAILNSRLADLQASAERVLHAEQGLLGQGQGEPGQAPQLLRDHSHDAVGFGNQMVNQATLGAEQQGALGSTWSKF